MMLYVCARYAQQVINFQLQNECETVESTCFRRIRFAVEQGRNWSSDAVLGVVDGVDEVCAGKIQIVGLWREVEWVPLSTIFVGSVPRSNSAATPSAAASFRAAAKAREANAKPHTRTLHTSTTTSGAARTMKNSEDQKEQAKGRQDHHHHHQLHLRQRIVGGARLSAKVMGAIIFCAVAPILYVVVPPAHDTGDRP